MKRHEVLGRELSATREWTLEYIQRDELALRLAQPECNGQQFLRELDIVRLLAAGVLEHLGYGPIPNLPNLLNQGVDRSIEYFFGDWWKDDGTDRIYLDKSRDDRELHWAEPFLNPMLLCALTGRWSDASRICSWIDDSVRLEYRFELNDYGFQLLYLCIASHFRPEPLSNLAEIQDAIRTSRPRRPKLLLSLWESALEPTQKPFAQGLQRSVKHRLSDRELQREIPNVLWWVAIEESFIWHVAERNGLTFPDVAPEVEASIVRRQTVNTVNR